MWSDPDESIDGFLVSPRGAGYLFGANVVDKFLERNGIEVIVRSHQLCFEGFMEHFGGKVLTVWSAPNYCYRFGNLATVLICGEDGSRVFKFFKEAKKSKEIENCFKSEINKVEYLYFN